MTFGTIRKHQRWLLALITIVVIISFVFFFSPNQNMGRGSAVAGYVDGHPVSDGMLRDHLKLADLYGYVRFGAEYRSAQAARMGFSRPQALARSLLIESRRKALGIEVSDAAIARWIAENLRDPRTQQVDFDAYVRNYLEPAGFTKTDFINFVRQEVAFREMQRLVGVTGMLVTPQEAESEFRRVNETYEVTLASFPASNFLAAVTVEDAALGTFYTNRLAEYRIPERAVLSYVRFELTNYLAEAAQILAGRPDLTNQIEQLYQQRGADAFRDDANNPLTKEAALEQIREGVTRQAANQIGLSNAVGFANELGQMEPLAASNLAALAAKKGLAVQATPPFGPGARPFGLEDIRDLGTGLGRVTPDQPFTPPMEGSRGIVIAAVTEQIPSTIPTLEDIRTRVESDFKEVQSAAAARTAGHLFRNAATNALASGKTLVEAAAGQPIRLSELTFTLSSPSISGLDAGLNPAQIKNAVGTNAPGALTPFVPTAEGGFLMLIRDRKPVDEETTRAALSAFLAEQRETREMDAFRIWFAEQMKQSGISKLVEDLRL